MYEIGTQQIDEKGAYVDRTISNRSQNRSRGALSARTYIVSPSLLDVDGHIIGEAWMSDFERLKSSADSCA